MLLMGILFAVSCTFSLRKVQWWVRGTSSLLLAVSCKLSLSRLQWWVRGSNFIVAMMLAIATGEWLLRRLAIATTMFQKQGHRPVKVFCCGILVYTRYIPHLLKFQSTFTLQTTYIFQPQNIGNQLICGKAA